MEAAGLLKEDFYRTSDTYKGTKNLPQAMFDQKKAREDRYKIRAEKVALEKFPNREDAVQAMIRYYEIQMQEVDRLFQSGESIFWSDLKNKIKACPTKKYLIDTFTLTTNIEISDFKCALRHY